MADLLAILSSAQTSLAAQRALTATAGHNIDNANTPGYSRQIASLVALTPADQVNGAFVGRGATLGTVAQARDRFLEAQIPAALASAARHGEESQALASFHGLDPDATTGLGPAISNFYSSLTALAQNPGDSGLRTAFLGAARLLAQTFNRTSQEIEASRTGLDAGLKGTVAEINTEAAAVASLNVQIRQARATGAEPNDLLDLRQGHLDRLAELAGGTPVPSTEGDVNVTTSGGVSLVSGSRAAVLWTQPDPANLGHLAVAVTGTDGSTIGALPNSAVGGKLGGTLAARDGALKTAGARVDQLAFDLGNAVNGVHTTGFDLDGNPGGPLFTVSATISAGAAAAIAVAFTDPRRVAAAATAAAVPGDNTRLNALLATETLGLTGGKDVRSTISDMVSQFGASAATAASFAEQDFALKDHLTTMRESYSGVSIDEEMIKLQQAQRGYEAIAKLIKTADEMLETLLNLR